MLLILLPKESKYVWRRTQTKEMKKSGEILPDNSLLLIRAQKFVIRSYLKVASLSTHPLSDG
jgi:hypothetical protein